MVHPTHTTAHPIHVTTPLVVDSPHSGRIYPKDFNYSCPLSLLRHTEDFLVDELIIGARNFGATVILAEFPRCYIDVNRAENDIDPILLAEPWPKTLAPSELTLQGLGLIRRLCRAQVPVYKAPLAIKTVENRILDYYRPYHETLSHTIDLHVQRFSECYLINCHSMPNRVDRQGSKIADFVLGDRDGTSCGPHFIDAIQGILESLGYTVARNAPYKGVEIVRRYGQPAHRKHALQLEINRRLYMDEVTLEKHEGFVKLQDNLKRVFSAISKAMEQNFLSAPKKYKKL